MNKVIFSGNLTRDVDVRNTASGKLLAHTGIAVRRRTKNADGDYDADFFELTAWGKTAELFEKYLRKGSAVLVEGRMQTTSVERDGVKRIFYDVVVDNIEFPPSKKKTGDSEELPDKDDSDVPF